jgi:hypothetical protein
MNMIYRRPMVEKSSTAELFSRRFRPCGPMATPERMRPTVPGIFIFLRRIGESSMINRTSEKTRTGLVNGRWNSCKS